MDIEFFFFLIFGGAGRRTQFTVFINSDYIYSYPYKVFPAAGPGFSHAEIIMMQNHYKAMLKIKSCS